MLEVPKQYGSFSSFPAVLVNDMNAARPFRGRRRRSILARALRVEPWHLNDARRRRGRMPECGRAGGEGKEKAWAALILRVP